MRATIDFRDLVNEHTRSLTIMGKTRKRAKTVMKSSAESLRGRIAERMPIDTGAAVYRWGNDVASDGIWRFEDDGLTNIQGAQREPYEYISRLNEGYSQQAPAGFIDAEAERAAEELADLLVDGIYVEIA